MAVIGIDYQEGANKKKVAASYKAVTLHVRSKKEKGKPVNKRFGSGDFIKDWYNAKKYFVLSCDHDPMLMGSSSIDHFIMKNDNVESAYLCAVEELYVDEGIAKKRYNAVLKYYNDEKDLLAQDKILDEGSEYFVPAGTRWTWEELKAYVKKGIVPKEVVKARPKKLAKKKSKA